MRELASVQDRRWGRGGPIAEAQMRCWLERRRREAPDAARLFCQGHQAAPRNLEDFARALIWSSLSAMPLSAGTRIGPYVIEASLGRGGMGEVYRARDARLDRDVAIKLLPDLLARDPEALSRFEREAKAVAALSHPNILAIHEFGSANDVVYAVTELLEGDTLRERLTSGPIAPGGPSIRRCRSPVGSRQRTTAESSTAT